MKFALVPATFAVAALLSGTAVARPPSPANLDSLVRVAMRDFGAPGLSLAIVKDGKTVVAKGYGVRSILTRTPVTADTLFPIGSETKAFTSAALAMLVDDGRLRWSDHVVDRLPGFRMYDSYATAHMTITDLLTHRSGLGLGEGDLLWVPSSNRSRADVVYALRYLKPKTGFREVFAYDNNLYIAAGVLLQSVSGEPWEHFVRQRILDPLGMSDATMGWRPGAPNGVALHTRTAGSMPGVGPLRVVVHGLTGPVFAPAGGINASAKDMAKWMALWERAGELPDGRRLLSLQAMRDLWTAVVVVPPSPGPPSLPHPIFQDYALGWMVEDEDGHKVVTHDGGVMGGRSTLYFIPDEDVAFSICINSEDTGTVRSLVYELLDYYLDKPQTDWAKVLLSSQRRSEQRQLPGTKHQPKPYWPHGHPSPPPRTYAGTYLDPWYGSMTISRVRGEGLWINFDRSFNMSGPLVQVAGNVFEAHWTNRTIPDAYVFFRLRDRMVDAISLEPVSPLADFSFDYSDLHFVPAH